MAKTFSCSVCPATFTRYWTLQRHVQSVHQGKLATCPLCSATFSRTDKLHHHISVEHGNNEQKNSAIGQSQEQVSHNDVHSFYFKHPFSMLVAAGSGFGKTFWVKRLLAEKERLIQPVPKRIVWCYMHWQPLYQEIKAIDPSIEFIEGLPLDLDAGFFSSEVNNLLIIDDMMDVVAKDSRITQLFTRGSHHENLSVICLLQSLYYKNTQTIRRNSHYLVLFDMPMDKTQVRTMSYQMFPNYPNHLLQMYHKAVSKPYGYLVVVSKPNIKQHERLKTDIFSDDSSIQMKNKASDNVTSSNVENPHSADETYQTITADKPVMVDGRPYKLVEILEEPEKVGGANENEAGSEAENSINSGFDSESDQSSTDSQSDNMYPCGYCGTLFDSKLSMSEHEKDCRNRYMDEEQEPYENAGFKYIRQKARERNLKEWREKIEKYEGQGMSESKAESKADEKLLPKDKKNFFEIYTNLLRLQMQLEDCKIHTDVVKQVKSLISSDEVKFDQAIRKAISRKRKELEIVMEIDSSDDEPDESMEAEQDEESSAGEVDETEVENKEEEDEEEEGEDSINDVV